MKGKGEKVKGARARARESRNTESRVGMGGGPEPGLLGTGARWCVAGSLGCWVLASAVQKVLAGWCGCCC